MGCSIGQPLARKKSVIVLHADAPSAQGEGRSTALRMEDLLAHNHNNLPVEPRGEGMLERLRGHALHFLDLGLSGVALHRAADVGGGDLRAFSGRELIASGFNPFLLDHIFTSVHPFLEFAKNFISHPEHAVRRSLAFTDRQLPAHEVDVLRAEGRRLRSPVLRMSRKNR